MFQAQIVMARKPRKQAINLANLPRLTVQAQTTEAAMNIFCIVSKPSKLSGTYVIESDVTGLESRRGVNLPDFALSRPCYEVTPTALKKIRADLKEVSQEEFCCALNL